MLLIFDLDPQAPDYSQEKIRRMASYFVESSDMGKLYLNYPMVEAFYHMRSIPDPEYYRRTASMKELMAGSYKARVNQENRNRDYRIFAVTREECSIVIYQNIDKAWQLVGHTSTEPLPPDQQDILRSQLSIMDREQRVFVLSTCPFFVAEYNPALLKSEKEDAQHP